ncbi:MAG: cytochrome c [Nitrospinae bacterium]|nr:cytochrome c [Nitrospinota bacterium]
MFKRKKRPGLILLFLVIFLPFFSQTAGADNVKKIYEKKCASCHGKDGKGNPSLVKMFKTELSLLDLIDKETQGKTDEDLVLITSKGIKNKMPAFRAELKEEEIKDVIVYIRSLPK